jgi:hypothetical protein
MVEVPETERPAAPVVGVDIAPEPLTMADGEPFPVPDTVVEDGNGDRRA